MVAAACLYHLSSSFTPIYKFGHFILRLALICHPSVTVAIMSLLGVSKGGVITRFISRLPDLGTTSLREHVRIRFTHQITGLTCIQVLWMRKRLTLEMFYDSYHFQYHQLPPSLFQYVGGTLPKITLLVVPILKKL